MGSFAGGVGSFAGVKAHFAGDKSQRDMGRLTAPCFSCFAASSSVSDKKNSNLLKSQFFKAKHAEVEKTQY